MPRNQASLLRAFGLFLALALACEGPSDSGQMRSAAMTKTEPTNEQDKLSYEEAARQQQAKQQVSASAGQSAGTPSPCPLDQPVSRVKITLTGDSLPERDLTANLHGVTAVMDEANKLYLSITNPDAATVGPSRSVSYEGSQLVLYRPDLEGQPANDPNAKPIDPTTTAFKLQFADLSGKELFSLDHIENKKNQDQQGNVSIEFLFGSRVKREFASQTTATLRSIASLKFDKPEFLIKVSDYCKLARGECEEGEGRRLRFGETGRFQMSELEVKLNDRLIFADKTPHIFALTKHDDDRLDTALTYTNGRSVSIDIAGGKAFQALTQALATQCP